MGKYKFRLSDMVPNAWFYKLRDMGHNRRRNHNYSIRQGLVGGSTSQLARKSFTSPSSSPKISFDANRASYYYSTAVLEARKNLNSPVHLTRRQDVDLAIDPPRKSKRRHHKVLFKCHSPKLVSTSASIRCNCSDGRDKHEIHATNNYETRIFDSEKPTRSTDFNSDITYRKNSIPKRLEKNKNSSDMIELALSPIRTRSDQAFNFKVNDDSFYTENKRPDLKTKRASLAVYRIRKRVVTTKNATKEKRLNRDRKESLAVMKYSSDPQRDFMESMIEMIIANNMRSSNDLEDLLACYLSLNSVDYHSVIVKVFKQVCDAISCLIFGVEHSWPSDDVKSQLNSTPLV
ncbi:Transcription repressor OFP3 [Carex littledalei]|uniref:Transcription repressor n=1 Tax=Carex littledalei TaxID=544730 RepID=A0A833VDS2_9POAL|nr:Transcription repressor OFP3 [Carex littledalei]